MNIKDLLVPLTLALVVTFGLQYYLSKKVESDSGTPSSGQVYDIKHEPEAFKPLKWSIDFIDKKDKEAQLMQVETEYGVLTFSTAGAALDKVELKHNAELLTFVDAHARLDKALIVAFEEETPYYFSLVDRKETDDDVILHYHRSFSSGKIDKIFTINRKVPKVDLTIKLDVPKDYKPTKKMRIFYPAPHINDKGQELTSFVNDQYNPQSLTLYRKQKEFLHRSWHTPTMFGLADRFFVNAMMRDEGQFIYRGAFNQPDVTHVMVAQLESNEIKESGEWSLSFYFGPKQLSLMKAVDPRLEKVLDFGIWGFFAKLILQALNLIDSYVRNYGLSIILLTLFLKLLLMPFTLKGQQGLAKTAEMERKRSYLKQKYRNDPERLKQEQAELLRKHGVGGMLGGCLPMLLQIPIFFSLNMLLRNSVELYNAKFLWIKNLAHPDPLYILPLIAGVLFLLHSQSMKATAGKSQISSYAFALLIGAMMAGFPAGVVLFVATMSAISVLEAQLKPKKSK